MTLTPHIAGASLKTIERAAEAAAEEVRRYLSGEAPLNPCGGVGRTARNGQDSHRER